MKALLTTLATFLVASTYGAEFPNCPTTKFNGDHPKVTFYPNADDCSKYFQCIGGILYNGSCTEGMIWNANSESCDWPSNYKCSSSNKMSVKSSRPAKLVDPSVAEVTCPPPSLNGSYNVTFYPHEEDCQKYWECDNGQLLEGTCPEGLVWVQELSTCDWEYLHPCDKLPKWAWSWWYRGTVERRRVVAPQPVRAEPGAQTGDNP